MHDTGTCIWISFEGYTAQIRASRYFNIKANWELALHLPACPHLQSTTPITTSEGATRMDVALINFRVGTVALLTVDIAWG
eukprot:356555-Hanusia_phi.AAC.2